METKRLKFRCMKCFGKNIKLLVLTNFDLTETCIGICQKCGTRKGLPPHYISFAASKFDHKEAEHMRRLRSRAYEYIQFKKNQEQKKRIKEAKRNKSVYK